jgi:hypothetical protein
MRADYLVYTHTRPDTNEIFYVGKGTGKRMKCRTNRNIHWQRIVDKANGFKYDVLAKNLTEQEALNFEILMIKKINKKDIRKMVLRKRNDFATETIRTKVTSKSSSMLSPNLKKRAKKRSYILMLSILQTAQ